MATAVIMPALEMAQDTGKLVRWLKRAGDAVVKGEPLMEVETDKVTVEIEAPASGVLAQVSAQDGDVIPVGQTVALILGEGEQAPTPIPSDAGRTVPQPGRPTTAPGGPVSGAGVNASPLARRFAEEHGVDLARVSVRGARIEKADVEAYLARQAPAAARPGRTLASPKARRMAVERGVDLAALHGSGPEGAVLSADVEAQALAPRAVPAPEREAPAAALPAIWRVMAERMTQSWTSAPHFYLMREVQAGALADMRERLTAPVQKKHGLKPTYSDLLVKLLATALRDHPRLNASWAGGSVHLNEDIHIGLATAVEDGLVVPIIHDAHRLSVGQIAAQRADLVERAAARKLRPADIAGGTFTLSNLGMYNVDAFNAIVNPPQAAILAAGRIAERVVAVAGQAVVRPTLIVTLSCDHRVVDGARAARFLDDLAGLIEEPWGVLA